ncbi:MAG: DUF3267 domain-containing protein [Clostridia bacterium]|nr:DUF3267 domain-containing protein [Clostridia bacterium]
MNAVNVLPEGYEEFYSLDLQKDKQKALLVNGLALAIGVLMAVPMHFTVPITTLFDISEGYIIRMLSLALLSVGYLILHELVHGVAMKICGTKKVKYGFTDLYAFAGSEDFYPKKPYIFIALAPVVLWGIVLAVVNFLVPTEWCWIIYLVQIMNISGAAGDFFVTYKFSQFPDTILVKDYGVGMVVYARHNRNQTD